MRFFWENGSFSGVRFIKLALTVHSGFSLIELMIIVVIIGILAGVAVPSYTTYLEDGRRAEGKAFALDIASRQERHFTQYSRYAGSLTGVGEGALNMTSSTSENSNYIGTIVMADGVTTVYTVNVEPQTADAVCGDLTLSNTGLRGAKGLTEGAIVSDCWR